MSYSKKPLIGIIMGSSSDSKVMQGAATALDEFGVKHEDQIVSAHRTPTRLSDYAKHAEKSGFKVIIAGAGGSAHLPGMIASHTIIPVIGVPIMVYND
ncbi:MAG: 5-(carboxyamino)imidazole ribonucleotide mutase, partial [Nitrosarchaeum sp.]